MEDLDAGAGVQRVDLADRPAAELGGAAGLVVTGDTGDGGVAQAHRAHRLATRRGSSRSSGWGRPAAMSAVAAPGAGVATDEERIRGPPSTSKMLGQPASSHTVCRPRPDHRVDLGELRTHLRGRADPLRLALDRGLRRCAPPPAACGVPGATVTRASLRRDAVGPPNAPGALIGGVPPSVTPGCPRSPSRSTRSCESHRAGRRRPRDRQGSHPELAVDPELTAPPPPGHPHAAPALRCGVGVVSHEPDEPVGPDRPATAVPPTRPWGSAPVGTPTRSSPVRGRPG